jgi:hypothetical protein
VEIGEHIAALRDEGDLMAKAIAAAEPDAPIPTCPEWTMRDLVVHTGTVHRWATANVTEPSDKPADTTVAPPDDASLGDWFREGVANLLTALQAASPWLVRLEKTDPLMGIWDQHGRGQNWGIMVDSDLSTNELHRHFRRFLQAKLPTGTIALFRFYDPRVFNTYIRAARPAEREPWFRGVRQYAVEGAQGVTHQYRLHGPQLLDGNAPVG